MDFSGLPEAIVSYAQSHTVIAIVLGLVLLFFIYRKPKLFFSLLILGLILAGVLYIITNTVGSGLDYKKRLIQEDEKHSSHTP